MDCFSSAKLKKKEKVCLICKKIINPKTADVNRGWGKCCSKSCAAVLREFKSQAKKLDKKSIQEQRVFVANNIFGHLELVLMTLNDGGVDLALNAWVSLKKDIKAAQRLLKGDQLKELEEMIKQIVSGLLKHMVD